jgi:DNA repair ATPase RecN
MQSRFEEIEKRLESLTKQSPCLSQVQDIKQEFNRKLSHLQEEQEEVTSKLMRSEQDRLHLLHKHQSLVSGTTDYLVERTAHLSKINQLQQEKEALNNKVSELTAIAAPTLKKLAAEKAESERRQRAEVLMQGSVSIGRLPLSDQYQIKKTKPW